MTDNSERIKYIKWLNEEIELRTSRISQVPRDSERYLQEEACRAAITKCRNHYFNIVVDVVAPKSHTCNPPDDLL